MTNETALYLSARKQAIARFNANYEEIVHKIAEDLALHKLLCKDQLRVVTEWHNKHFLELCDNYHKYPYDDILNMAIDSIYLALLLDFRAFCHVVQIA